MTNQVDPSEEDIPADVAPTEAPSPAPTPTAEPTPTDRRPTGLAGQRVTAKYAAWLAKTGIKESVGIEGQKVTPQYRAWLEKKEFVPTRPEPKPFYNIPLVDPKRLPSLANIAYHEERASRQNLPVRYTSLPRPGWTRPGAALREGVIQYDVSLERMTTYARPGMSSELKTVMRKYGEQRRLKGYRERVKEALARRELAKISETPTFHTAPRVDRYTQEFEVKTGLQRAELNVGKPLTWQEKRILTASVEATNLKGWTQEKLNRFEKALKNYFLVAYTQAHKYDPKYPSKNIKERAATNAKITVNTLRGLGQVAEENRKGAFKLRYKLGQKPVRDRVVNTIKVDVKKKVAFISANPTTLTFTHKEFMDSAKALEKAGRKFTKKEIAAFKATPGLYTGRLAANIVITTAMVKGLGLAARAVTKPIRIPISKLVKKIPRAKSGVVTLGRNKLWGGGYVEMKGKAYPVLGRSKGKWVLGKPGKAIRNVTDFEYRKLQQYTRTRKLDIAILGDTKTLAQLKIRPATRNLAKLRRQLAQKRIAAKVKVPFKKKPTITRKLGKVEYRRQFQFITRKLRLNPNSKYLHGEYVKIQLRNPRYDYGLKDIKRQLDKFKPLTPYQIEKDLRKQLKIINLRLKAEARKKALPKKPYGPLKPYAQVVYKEGNVWKVKAGWELPKGQTSKLIVLSKETTTTNVRKIIRSKKIPPRLKQKVKVITIPKAMEEKYGSLAYPGYGLFKGYTGARGVGVIKPVTIQRQRKIQSMINQQMQEQRSVQGTILKLRQRQKQLQKQKQTQAVKQKQRQIQKQIQSQAQKSRQIQKQRLKIVKRKIVKKRKKVVPKKKVPPPKKKKKPRYIPVPYWKRKLKPKKKRKKKKKKKKILKKFRPSLIGIRTGVGVGPGKKVYTGVEIRRRKKRR